MPRKGELDQHEHGGLQEGSEPVHAASQVRWQSGEPNDVVNCRGADHPWL